MDDGLSEFDDEAGIDMTPLINLSLVLVMIFLVTSPFFAKELMPVNLPAAVSSETERDENVTISISPSEGYAINEVPIRKSALQHELRRSLRDSLNKYVLIRADERIPHGEIEDVLKTSKKLGAKRVAFATVPKL